MTTSFFIQRRSLLAMAVLTITALAGQAQAQAPIQAVASFSILGDLVRQVGGERVKLQQEPDWAAVLALTGTHLHLYGKTDARLGRKMGHLTVTGASPQAARATALKAAAILGIEAF